MPDIYTRHRCAVRQAHSGFILCMTSTLAVYVAAAGQRSFVAGHTRACICGARERSGWFCTCLFAVTACKLHRPKEPAKQMLYSQQRLVMNLLCCFIVPLHYCLCITDMIYFCRVTISCQDGAYPIVDTATRKLGSCSNEISGRMRYPCKNAATCGVNYAG